jgi:hypothetical protein
MGLREYLKKENRVKRKAARAAKREEKTKRKQMMREKRQAEREADCERKRKRNKALKLAKSIAKGKCSDSKQTLEEIRNLGASDGAKLSKSYLKAAAASQGEVKNGLVMLAIIELNRMFDHEKKRNLLKSNIELIEQICGQSLDGEEAAEAYLLTQGRSYVNEKVLSYQEGNVVPDAPQALLGIAHGYLKNGNFKKKKSAGKSVLQLWGEKRYAARIAADLAHGYIDNVEAALQEVRATPEWDSKIVLNLLKAQARETFTNDQVLEIMAVTYVGYKALNKDEQETVHSKVNDEFKENLGRKVLTYLAQYRYKDKEFWSKALGGNGECREAVAIMLKDKEEGWPILADNIEQVKRFIGDNQEFVVYVLEQSQKPGSKLEALSMFNGKKDGNVDRLLYEVLRKESDASVRAKAFEMLVKRDEGGRDAKISSLLRMGRMRATNGEQERYTGLLEEVLLRKNGELRDGVLRSLLQAEDKSGAQIIVANYGQLYEPISKLEAELAQRACAHTIREGNAKGKELAFEQAAGFDEPGEELLDALATQLENGNQIIAMNILAQAGVVPAGAIDKITEALGSEDTDVSSAALAVVTNALGEESKEEIEQTVRSMLAKSREGEFWESLLSDGNAQTQKFVANALFKMKDEGGWKTLVLHGDEIPESKELEAVLEWGMDCEEHEVKVAALDRIKMLENIKSNLFEKVLGYMDDPRYMGAPLTLMHRNGAIPEEVEDKVLALVSGENRELGFEVLNMVGGMEPKTKKMLSCIKSAVMDPKRDPIKLVAIEFASYEEELAGDEQLLKELAELSRVLQPDEFSENALGALALLSTQSEEAKKTLNELLDDAKEALDSADHIEQVWAWATIANLDSKQNEQANELLREKLIPELVDIIAEEPEEKQVMFMQLIDLYGSPDRIIKEMQSGGLTPNEGQYESMLECEDGTCLTEKDIIQQHNNAMLRVVAAKFLGNLQDAMFEYLDTKDEEFQAKVKDALGIEEQVMLEIPIEAILNGDIGIEMEAQE